MENIEKVYKRNTLFIILIGIVGFCFGILDWDSNLADLVYLKYNNKLLISFISANIGTARLIASIYCIKINDSKKPNYVFKMCMILCSIIAIISAILFDAEFIILFVITYLIEVILLEIFSGYHYAYALNSLPKDKVNNAHSKRISVFKITQTAGIALAGFICAKFTNHAFLLMAILTILTFLLAITFVNQVKNFPLEKKKKKENLFKKLNIFKYTKYFRKWLVVRLIGRFALASLIVLLSIRAIDNNLNLYMLKTTKSLLWVLSGIGFFLSNYFTKKKMIVKGDIVFKSLIAILLPMVLINPQIIFIIILLYGMLDSFNAMSHLEMLKYDKDNINLAQKDLVINLFGYVAKMLSGYILLSINNDLAIIIAGTLLFISVFFELKLYIANKDKK